MVAPPLVEPYIEQGRLLVDALSRGGLDVKAALWMYRGESDDWRLVIATDLVEQVGPRETYARIQGLLSAESGIKLRDITVIKPGDPLVRAVRKALKSGAASATVRLRGTVLDGVYLEDVLAYRLDGDSS
jgi:hypothetical protein